MNDELIRLRHKIDWVSSCALRYHNRRRTFLDKLARLDPAITLISGGTTFGALAAKEPDLAQVFAATTAILSALSLSFGFSDRAQEHRDLYRRWAALRADLAKVKPSDEDGLRRLDAELEMIGGDTPGQMEVLSVVVENEERASRGSVGHCRVFWYQRFFAPLISLPPFNFPEQCAAPPPPIPAE
jgi:hypothetical protein